jgi:hypothetical protein
MRNTYKVMENLGRYAVMNSIGGVINGEVNYIINHTGAQGTMFQVVKYYLFGEKNDEIEAIIYQNDLREMMRETIEIEIKLKENLV